MFLLVGFGGAGLGFPLAVTLLPVRRVNPLTPKNLFQTEHGRCRLVSMRRLLLGGIASAALAIEN